jgi:ABC-type molybdate transport system substrate-binding protein
MTPNLRITPTIKLMVSAVTALACLAQPSLAADASSSDTLAIYAAGSLRGAMTDLAQGWEKSGSAANKTSLTFGASGLLRDRIAGGEKAQVYASANMSHPQSLQAGGQADAVVAFARNALCVLAAADFSLAGKPLAQRLLDADVRVATSTPKADPAGDYAFEMFARIESTGAAGAGSAAALEAKALQLAGGPTSPQPPAGRTVYGLLMEQRRADAFVTYCTNAALAQREVPGLQVLPVPPAINVSASYGITAIKPVTPGARSFIDFVLGPSGQGILARHGFSAP